MAEKIQRVGICDHCLGPIRRDFWYIRKTGLPRLHCCRDCRNAANSRKGAPIRSREQLEHVARGEWQNPAKLRPPTGKEQADRARKGRLREVQAGKWRNPGLTTEAREINSRPRKHSGALASAIDRLDHGARVSDLTPEEQEAHRAYRRELARQRRGRKQAPG